jgi:hypothetical protein
VLGLTLVRWQGVHEGVEATWLRWATPGGTVIPTPWELADQERARRMELEARIAELERREQRGGGTA